MSESIQIEGLEQLQRLTSELQAVKGQLSAEALLRVVERIESAVSLVVGHFDEISKAVGADPDTTNPFEQRRLQEIEDTMRVLGDTLGAVVQGAALGAIAGPAGAAAGAITLGSIAFALSATEPGRRFELARKTVELRNFAEIQRQEREALAKEIEERRVAVLRATRAP